VYRDDNHLTGSFAETLVPAMEAELVPILDAEPAASRGGLR